MKKRIFWTVVLICLLATTGYAQSKPSSGADSTLAGIVRKTLGKDVRITHIDGAESSPVKGFRQIRVWLETRYGETPVLFYVSGDGRFFIAGSIFDSDGNNLTAQTVGKTRPRVLSDKEMRPDDRYSIGPSDARVRVVLWLGMDPLSKIAFETFYEMFLKNKDVMSLYLKFYPKTEREAEALQIAACGKKEKTFEIFRSLLDVAPGWGGGDDIEQFREKKGFKDASCGAAAIRDDIALEKSLKLPRAPVVFVNGTMLIEKMDKDNVEKVAGLRLK